MSELVIETNSLRRGQEKMKYSLAENENPDMPKRQIADDSFNYSSFDLQHYAQQKQVQTVEKNDSKFKQQFCKIGLQKTENDLNRTFDASQINFFQQKSDLSQEQGQQMEERQRKQSIGIQQGEISMFDIPNKYLIEKEKTTSIKSLKHADKQGTNGDSFKNNKNNNICSLIHLQQSSGVEIKANQRGSNAAKIVKTYQHVKRFISKLKAATMIYYFKRLTYQQFKIIGDRSAEYGYYAYQRNIIQTGKDDSFMNKIYHKFRSNILKQSSFNTNTHFDSRKVLSHLFFLQSNTLDSRQFMFLHSFMTGKYLFSLDTTLRFIWDIFIMMFTFYLIIMIPLIHIDLFPSGSFIYFIHDHAIQWILVTELIVTINSEIYKSGITIRDRRIIFKENFWNIKKDLFTLVMYIYSRNKSQNIISYLDYIVLFKYLDIPNKIQEFELKLQINDSIKNWMRLIKLEILVLILAHVSCCIFINIGKFEKEKGILNWIDKFSSDQSSIGEIYLSSLYFMIITVCTIGYGDITAITSLERGFVIIVALLATNVTAYAFSQISEIVKFEDNKKQSLNNILIGLNYQMKAGGLCMNLQQKVRKYFQYIHQMNQKRLNIQEELIDKLPYNLKEEVLLDINKEFVNFSWIFHDFSPKCLKQISLAIKQRQLLPDETLIQEKQQNECLYFVTLGNLEILCSVRQQQEEITYRKSFQRLKKKDTFGYEGFLFGNNSPYSIKSLGSSIVSYLDKNILLQILKQFPNDYEKFCYIRDKAIYGKSFQRYQLNCISCGQPDHQLQQCPSTKIKIKMQPSKQNDRNPNFQRKKNKFNNLLINIQSIQQKAMEALVNNDESLFLDALIVYNNSQLTEIDEDETASSSSEQSLQNAKNNKNFSHKTQSKIEFNQQQQQYLEDSQRIKHSSSKNFENFSLKKANSKPQTSQFQETDQQSDKKFTIYFRNDDSTIEQVKSPLIGPETDLQNLESILKNNFPSDENLIEQKSVKFLVKSNQRGREDSVQEKTVITAKTHKNGTQTEKIKDFNRFLTDQPPEIQLLKLTFEQRQKQAQARLKQAERTINDRMNITKLQTVNSITINQPKKEEEIEDVLNRRRSSTICDTPNQKPQQSYLNMIQMLAGKNQLKMSKLKKIQMSKEIIKQKLEQNPSQYKDCFRELNPQTMFEEQNQSLNQSSTQGYSKDKQQTNEKTTEHRIRSELNLQNLDMLVVRKQFLLMQQQHIIENYIEVPDNELDIDALKGYFYYYKNSNVKFVLQKIKQLQEEKMKEQALLGRKKKKLSYKKSPRALKFRKNSNKNNTLLLLSNS